MVRHPGRRLLLERHAGRPREEQAVRLPGVRARSHDPAGAAADVGNADFFDILDTWLADHAGATGSTAQFTDVSESVSGQELSAFFDEWLFTAGKPTPCQGP